MKFLDHQSSWQVAKEFGYTATSNDEEVELGAPGTEALRVVFEKWPAYRLVSLSRVISEAVQPFDSCLLVFTEYGIWPSSEDHYAFRKLRSAYGETGPIHDMPGQQFSAHEADDLRPMLMLALLFGWGGYVLPKAISVERSGVYFSHDGWLEVSSNRGFHPFLANLADGNSSESRSGAL